MHPDAEQDDDRRELFLDREVRDLVDDLVQLLETAGRDEDVRQLRELQAEARNLGDEPATLVVVGETGRGKSSMINALLSRPGLLPVDFDTATSTTIIVQHGERERAEMLSGGGTDVTEVEMGELARWATVAGERQRVADAEDARDGDRARDLAAPVHSLVVSTPAELLADGLVLIDTPGVGGLDGDHARITLQALKDADALLFVLAPDAGISRPELDFLKQATNRIGVVLFVIAKIDQTRAWREIQDEDRYLIGAEVPLFAHAPVLGISSNRKAEADRFSARGEERPPPNSSRPAASPNWRARSSGMSSGGPPTCAAATSPGPATCWCSGWKKRPRCAARRWLRRTPSSSTSFGPRRNSWTTSSSAPAWSRPSSNAPCPAWRRR